MKSKASIQGHPIHPILIPFPIAFFIGTFLFDAGALLFDKHNWAHTAGYLNFLGIIAAVLAALPGAIDYFKTIPPNSSAKKRGTKHALVNSSALILFVVSFVLRRGTTFPSVTMVSLELLAVGLLLVGGWLGGSLVYKNQIGVATRYAEGGKWKEEYFDPLPPDSVKVGNADELKLNQMKLLHIGDKRIVLGRTENGYVAFDDSCTHKGGSLAGGTMICGTVQCPWHGSQFGVENGEVKAGPAKVKIKTYVVEQKENHLFLKL